MFTCTFPTVHTEEEVIAFITRAWHLSGMLQKELDGLSVIESGFQTELDGFYYRKVVFQSDEMRIIVAFIRFLRVAQAYHRNSDKKFYVEYQYMLVNDMTFGYSAWDVVSFRAGIAEAITALRKMPRSKKAAETRILLQELLDPN
ncbi:hypothetical protein BH11PAT2_BH11PAT2_03910 [soil metagenome]